jgi:cytochrome c oxidase subunit 1
VIYTHTSKKVGPAPFDPWDARSLEWMTSNPPKEHNFDSIPTVHALDEFFHRKYEEVEDENGRHVVTKVRSGEEVLAELEANPDTHIHMPSPSYWPILLSLGLPIIGYGLIYNRWIAVVGALVVVVSVFGWALEPSVADDDDLEPPAEAGGHTKELSTLG